MNAQADMFSGRRILVVEDDYFLAQDLKQALERKGATVAGPVARIEDALAMLDAEPPPEAAILDINLGGQSDVYPLAEALRNRGIPFAFVTGYDQSYVRRDFADVPLLAKPFNPRDLQPALFQ